MLFVRSGFWLGSYTFVVASLLISLAIPPIALSSDLTPHTFRLIFSNNMDAEYQPCGG